MNTFSKFASQLFRGSVSSNSYSYINRQNVGVSFDPSGTDYIDYSNNAYFTDSHNINPNYENTTSLILNNSDSNYLNLSSLDEFTIYMKYQVYDSSNIPVLGQIYNNPNYDISFSNSSPSVGDSFQVYVLNGSGTTLTYSISGDFTSANLNGASLTGSLPYIENILDYTISSGGGEFKLLINVTDVSGIISIIKTYWVTVQDNLFGENVFAFSETGENGTFYNQKSLTFTTGDSVRFDVSDPSNDEFILDFGSTIDSASADGVYLNADASVNIVSDGGNKYVFNNVSTYDSSLVYKLSTGTYIARNVPIGHPIAVLNSGNITNITYNVLDETPIVIKVSGGDFSYPYYDFTDEDNNAIDIAGGVFYFMRGRTYQFVANGVSSSHPFKVHSDNGDSSTLTGSGGSFSVTIPVTQSLTAGDLYYICAYHSTMKANMSRLNNAVTGTTSDGIYDFYYGDVQIDVLGDFGTVSVYCYYHGYMGGENIFTYSVPDITPYITRTGIPGQSSAIVALTVPESYSGDVIYYFEDSSANMGYKPAISEEYFQDILIVADFSENLFTSDDSSVWDTYGYKENTYIRNESTNTLLNGTYVFRSDRSSIAENMNVREPKSVISSINNWCRFERYVEILFPFFIRVESSQVTFRTDNEAVSDYYLYGIDAYDVSYELLDVSGATLNDPVRSISSNKHFKKLHIEGKDNHTRIKGWAINGYVIDSTSLVSGTTSQYEVTVSGDVFSLSGTDQLSIAFEPNNSYLFDQSDPTNAGQQIVFGYIRDNSSNIFTSADGVTIMGTPGQPGAYTYLDLSTGFTGTLYYYSDGSANMGMGILSDYAYSFTVQNNIYDEPVWAVYDDANSIYYNQPDLSFSAPYVYEFDVSDPSNNGYVLSFGTTVDVYDASIESSYVTRTKTPGTTDAKVLLDLTNYSGDNLVYFEDSSANMGYTEYVAYTTITESSVYNPDINSREFDGTLSGNGYRRENAANLDTTHDYGGWNADLNQIPNAWMEIRLSADTNIAAVITQGNKNYDQWVTSYRIKYSTNADLTTFYDVDGRTSWNGNNDRNTKLYHYFSSTLTAQYIRIYPLSYSVGASMRAGLSLGTVDVVPAYAVTISNEVFYLDGSANPQIDFLANESYVFDQSDPTNDGQQIVFGYTPDDTVNILTPVDGVTIMGTPGQPGAYTQLDLSNGFVGPLYYYSDGSANMGWQLVADISYQFTVKTNIYDEPVWALYDETNTVWYNQPDLSFSAPNVYEFDVSDPSNNGYVLSFGTTVDVYDATIESTYVTRTNTPGTTDAKVLLDLENYSGANLVYFEDTSAGMGYVEEQPITSQNILQSDFDPTTVLSNWATNTSNNYFTYTLSGNNTYSFANGTYDISASDINSVYGLKLNQVLKDGGGSYNGYDWHGQSNYDDSGVPPNTYVTTVDGVDYNGSWIQLSLPYKMQLTEVSVTGRPGYSSRALNEVLMAGSNDNGATFEYIDEISFIKTTGNQSRTVTATNGYSIIRMIVKTSHGSGSMNLEYWNITGHVVEDVYTAVPQTIVTVSNEVFYLDGSANPQIDFYANESYVFDQSDPTNDGQQIIFGYTADDTNILTPVDGVTVMGTPGQSGAYTQLDLSSGFVGPLYYYSDGSANMGWQLVADISYQFTVKTNIYDEPVWALYDSSNSVWYNQPDLSFSSPNVYEFDVSDPSNNDYVLSFGTIVDVSDATIESTYVTRTNTPGETDAKVLLDLRYYSGDNLVYFEDTSAGIGYVEEQPKITFVENIIQSDFDPTTVLSNWATNTSNNYFTYTLSGNNTYSFANGTYDISASDINSVYGLKLNQVLKDGGGSYNGYDWHGQSNYDDSGVPPNTYVTTVDGVDYNGSWIQLALPYKLRLTQVALTGRYETYGDFSEQMPKDVIMAGSNDNGATFEYIVDVSFSRTVGTNNHQTQNATATNGYSIIRMVIKKSHGLGGMNLEYWNVTGHVVEDVELVVTVTPTIVTVSNEVFYLDGSAKPPFDFYANESYVFDQSDPTNDDQQIVFGYIFDDSANILTSADGVTVMGTPGQPGAYTQLDLSSGFVGPLYYYSDGSANMGSNMVYVPPSPQLLVVGGGGSGGSHYSGGGGAGGMVTTTLTITSSTSYNIVVGEGGSGNDASQQAGYNGTNSSFDSYTATGGGGGGYFTGGSGAVGATGGSGGGGSGGTDDGINPLGGSGMSGQGNSGGNGTHENRTQKLKFRAGGGGGGSGSAGSDASSGYGGDGGDASQWVVDQEYYAAGGGGGTRNDGSPSDEKGGNGGGYTVSGTLVMLGGSGYGSDNGTSGVQNTGSGGGAWGSTETSGANGIVKLWIPYDYTYDSSHLTNVTGSITVSSSTFTYGSTTGTMVTFINPGSVTWTPIF